MQQGRKLQLFARKSSSIVIALQPGRQRCYYARKATSVTCAGVIRLLRIWYRVKLVFYRRDQIYLCATIKWK